jgi:hypothetical protein
MSTRTTTTQTKTDTETQLVNDVLARFHFTEPRYRSLFESHATQVLRTLGQLGRESTVESVITHIAPEQLGILGSDLPTEERARLLSYLAKLPEWVSRYLSDASEFSLEILRERGWSPASAA